MSALAKGPLTVAEAEFLSQCEDTIDAGLMTFVEVGQALVSIRDNRLYRAEHATFEDYCAQRWQISRPRAYELIGAAAVVSAMADTGLEPPANERQARELARVPEPQRAEVWKQTLEATEGKPTAAAVREVAKGTHETSTPAADRHTMPASMADVVCCNGHCDDGCDTCSPTTDQPEDRPAEVADPAPAAADGAGPHPVPSAPSPLEAYLAADPDLSCREWRKNFLAAIGKSFHVARFTPEQVAENADRQLVDELRRLVTDLDDYATRAEKAWNQRNSGLRVLKGGAA